MIHLLCLVCYLKQKGVLWSHICHFQIGQPTPPLSFVWQFHGVLFLPVLKCQQKSCLLTASSSRAERWSFCRRQLGQSFPHQLLPCRAGHCCSEELGFVDLGAVPCCPGSRALLPWIGTPCPASYQAEANWYQWDTLACHSDAASGGITA